MSKKKKHVLMLVSCDKEGRLAPKVQKELDLQIKHCIMHNQSWSLKIEYPGKPIKGIRPTSIVIDDPKKPFPTSDMHYEPISVKYKGKLNLEEMFRVYSKNCGRGSDNERR